jgi:hypothetical protein
MAVEEKWKANLIKVAYMKQFPGLLPSWAAAQGKTVGAVFLLPSKPGSSAMLFTDGTFLVTPALAPEPWQLGEALSALRPLLEQRQAAAYAEYDRLVAQDREALRVARVEKILGAIDNNLALVPELKDRIRTLVKSWE